MSKKMVVLALGGILAVGLGGLAVVGNAPPILASAAALAFVAVGYVVPARGLPLLIVRRQRKLLGVAGAAFLFAFLGIWLSWASAVALEATDSYVRFSGWVALGGFSALGSGFVAAIRRVEGMKVGYVEEPKP